LYIKRYIRIVCFSNYKPAMEDKLPLHGITYLYIKIIKKTVYCIYMKEIKLKFSKKIKI
jgi:hypothetical protein